ncbi:hypothetical protein [Micrococcoides hystricis]|uniref:Uncharacterized protein n=1 Tax=Micrococcoides hystricis TaxID=1572761 RepID=A0ABV6P8W0_9MICC
MVAEVVESTGAVACFGFGDCAVALGENEPETAGVGPDMREVGFGNNKMAEIPRAIAKVSSTKTIGE